MIQSPTQLKQMGTIQTLPWDMADHIETKEDIIAYLNIALEDDDSRLMTAVFQAIARSKIAADIRKADPSNEAFHHSLNEGSYTLEATLKWLKSLGIRLEASANVSDVERDLQEELASSVISS